MHQRHSSSSAPVRQQQYTSSHLQSCQQQEASRGRPVHAGAGLARHAVHQGHAMAGCAALGVLHVIDGHWGGEGGGETGEQVGKRGGKDENV